MPNETTKPHKTKRSMPVAAEYLNGETPHQRAAKKRQLVIDWVYRWGYSSSAIIQRLGGAKGGNLAAALVKTGLLISTRTESGGALKGVPARYFTLTTLGLQDAERHSDVLLRCPEIDPYKVNQAQLRHYLITQNLVSKSLLAGSVLDYFTERMLDSEGDQPGIKRPDCVVINAEGQRIALEIELSAKWSRVLDEFVLRVVRTLQTTSADMQSPEFYEFLIVSDSKAIIRRYQAALSPNARIPVWVKNARGYWVIDHTMTVPPEVSSRVRWLLLD